jgi:hypothetical protein
LLLLLSISRQNPPGTAEAFSESLRQDFFVFWGIWGKGKNDETSFTERSQRMKTDADISCACEVKGRRGPQEGYPHG